MKNLIVCLTVLLMACAPERINWTLDSGEEIEESAPPSDTLESDAETPDDGAQVDASADAVEEPVVPVVDANASSDVVLDTVQDAPTVDATDAGVRDSGTLIDTGVIVDSGVRFDSGVVTDSGIVVDTGVPPRDTGLPMGWCSTASDCNDGNEATLDLCFSNRCEYRSCDDGNPCTRDVATSMGCANTVLPNGTQCRPGVGFVCTAGVCPACGGEGQPCCEWPGSTQVCLGVSRCRTVLGGFRRCITCGGPTQRCCTSADGITSPSQRCNAGLSCISDSWCQ